MEKQKQIKISLDLKSEKAISAKTQRIRMPQGLLEASIRTENNDISFRIFGWVLAEKSAENQRARFKMVAASRGAGDVSVSKQICEKAISTKTRRIRMPQGLLE